MKSSQSLKQEYLKNLRRELDGKALYESLSQSEKNPKLALIYKKISEAENRHAQLWISKLQASGVAIPKLRPSWRTRALIWLSKHFGVGFVLPSVQSLEQADRRSYSAQVKDSPEAADMTSEEGSHSRLLSQITGMSTGVEGGILAKFEGRHRSVGGNALRAAVLGANDGLVSNLSLVMGVAGATASSATILIGGIAGLVAGALSMALGEWLSVKSSRELYEHEITAEKAEIVSSPEEEANELSLIYQAKGLDEKSANNLANQIISNQEKALETLSREELGIEPQTLGGSALEAAVTSFLLFTGGAIIPVIPFLLISGFPAVVASLAFSAIMLFVIGAAVTIFTGRSVIYSGGRQVLFGLAAAAVTFGVGHLFGTLIR